MLFSLALFALSPSQKHNSIAYVYQSAAQGEGQGATLYPGFRTQRAMGVLISGLSRRAVRHGGSCLTGVRGPAQPKCPCTPPRRPGLHRCAEIGQGLCSRLRAHRELRLVRVLRCGRRLHRPQRAWRGAVVWCEGRQGGEEDKGGEAHGCLEAWRPA